MKFADAPEGPSRKVGELHQRKAHARSTSATILAMALFCFASTIVLLLAMAPAAKAQQQIDVQTSRVGSSYDQERRLMDIVGHSHDDPLTMGQVVLPESPSGTHLRLRYRSSLPFLVEVAQDGSQLEDAVEAVLPLSEDGIAFIDLMQSPTWNASRRGLILRAYTREQAEPEILEGGVVWEAGLWQQLLAYLRHPFNPEVLTITSTNYLFGYRVGNVPVVLVMGLAMMIVALISMYRSGDPPFDPFNKFRVALSDSKGDGLRMTRLSAAVVVAFLLLYNARFLADAAIAGSRDNRDWASRQTLHEMGDLYAATGALQLEDDVKEVTHCGDMATPLRYLLYPVPVESPERNWDRASHGVLMGLWDEDDGIVYCGERSRRGEVIETFTDGGGIVRFSDQ